MNVSLAKTFISVHEGDNVVEFVLHKTAGAVGPVKVLVQTFDGTATGECTTGPPNTFDCQVSQVAM